MMKKNPVVDHQKSTSDEEIRDKQSSDSDEPVTPHSSIDSTSKSLPSRRRSSYDRRKTSSSKETLSTTKVLSDHQDTVSESLPSCSKSDGGFVRRISDSSSSPLKAQTKLSKSSKKEKANEFHENNLVFATIEGHKPWPAKITGFFDHPTKKNTKMCSVQFYGSHQTGTCPVKNLSNFLNNREKYFKKYRNEPGYLHAQREVKERLVRDGFESDNDSSMSESIEADTLPTVDSDETDDDSSGEEFGRINKSRMEKSSKCDKLFDELMKKIKAEHKKKGGSLGAIVTDDPVKLAEQYIMFQTMVTTKPIEFENKMNMISCALEFDEHHKICTDKFTGKMYEFKVEIKKNDVGVLKEIYNKEHIDQFMVDIKRMNELVNYIEDKGVEQCIAENIFTDQELTNIMFQGDHQVIQNELKRLDGVRKIAMKNEITLLMYVDKLRKYLTVQDCKMDKVRTILIKLNALDVTHVMLKKNSDVLQVILMLTGYKVTRTDDETLEFKDFVINTSYEILIKWAKLLGLKIDETIPDQLEHVMRIFNEKINETSVLDQIKLFDDVSLEEAPDFKVSEMFSADETSESFDSDEDCVNEETHIKDVARGKVTTRGDENHTSGTVHSRGGVSRGRGTSRKKCPTNRTVDRRSKSVGRGRRCSTRGKSQEKK